MGRGRIADRLLRGASHPGVLVAIALCAPLLNLPSLALGLRGDDHIQRALVLGHLRGSETPGEWYEIFGVRNPDGAASVRAQIEAGWTPWWTHPELSMALLRPVSAATHYLDYALWPDAVGAMHAHSLLWYGLLVLAVGLFYRRLMSPGWAALATLLYGIDEAHSETAAWLAARNTSLGALGAVCALLAYERWIRRGRRQLPVLAACALALALLSTEGAIAIWAFFVAHALFLDRAPWRERLRALSPLALVTALWLAMYRVLGFGAYGSGVYVDPVDQPLRFLGLLPRRWGELFVEQFGLPRMLTFYVPEKLHPVLFAAAITLAALVAWAFVAAVRERRTLAFWGAATALALVPYCTFSPEPRLLLLPSVGAFALLVELIEVAVTNARVRLGMRRPLLVAILGVSLVVHGPVAMALAPRKATELGLSELAAAYGANTLLRQPVTGKTVFVLNTTNFLMTFLSLVRVVLDHPPFASVHVFGASTRAIRVSRPRADRIVLEPEGGYLLEPTSLWIRSEGTAFLRGESMLAGPVRVTVTRVTADGRPAQVSLELADPESERYLWLTHAYAFEPFQLPAVGSELWLTPDLRLPTFDEVVAAARR